MKLYATIENSKGKTVSMADNKSMTVNLQLKNTILCKVYISYDNGEIVIDAVSGDEDEQRLGTWYDRPQVNGKKTCKHDKNNMTDSHGFECHDCGYYEQR